MSTPFLTRPLGLMLRQFKCWLGLHRLCVAPERSFPRQGACLYCGARFEGHYDPMYGETHWRPR